MKKSINRFLSVLLAAALLCSLFAFVPVSAAETKTLQVEATSNLFESSETTVNVEGTTYVIVEYKLNAPGKLIVNADVRGLTYDPNVLEWKEEYNQIGEGRNAKTQFFTVADEANVEPIVRKTEEGRIIGNFSTVKPLSASTEAGEAITFITAVFKVLDPDAGSTKVDCQVKYLALCDEEYDYSPFVQYAAVKEFVADKTLVQATSSAVSAENDLFYTQTLSLYGDIVVNFYLNVTDAQVAEGVQVDFWWYNNHETVTLTEDNQYYGMYRADCHIAPAEINDVITAKLTIGGKQLHQVKKYAAWQYADFVVNNPEYFSEQPNLVPLVKALLDYCTKAQISFNHTGVPPYANGGTDYLTNDVTDEILALPDPKNSLYDNSLETEYGLKHTGSTLVLLTKTTIRHYFKVVDSEKFAQVKDTATFNGKSVKYTEKNGEIYFDLTDIVASELDKSFDFTIGEKTYDFSAFNYAKNCLNSTRVSQQAKDLAIALYRYGLAAKKFFPSGV